MYCTQCGNQIQGAERFCSQCGAAANSAASPAGPPRRLALDPANKKVAGVCAGIAAYLGWDVTLIRILFLAGIAASGGSLVIYLVCWVAMPRNDAPAMAQ
jgi:phage shock protein C